MAAATSTASRWRACVPDTALTNSRCRPLPHQYCSRQCQHDLHTRRIGRGRHALIETGAAEQAGQAGGCGKGAEFFGRVELPGEAIGVAIAVVKPHSESIAAHGALLGDT